MKQLTPNEQLANLSSASGCKSILDAQFARYLDLSDPLSSVRYEFSVPTVESMARKPELTPPPTPAGEVIARNTKLRNRRHGCKRGDRTDGSQSAASGSTDVFSDEHRSDADTTSSSGEEEGEAATQGPSRRAARQFRSNLQSEAGQSANHGGNQSKPSPDSPMQPTSGASDDMGANGQLDGSVPVSATTVETSAGPSQSQHNPQGQNMIVYLAGNSLGLMCKRSLSLIQEEISVWHDKAVTAWMDHYHKRPWSSYAEKLAPYLAGIVGAKTSEVASMGTLTANLHLLMCSFYRPTKDRYKILYEHKAFPSDNYAFASQAEMHGYTREDALISVKPRQGEYTLRTEDMLDIIEKEGDRVAVVFFSGVQYFTGQCFEMQRITEAAHRKGCLVGWDLAHAIGNVPLSLHDWKVDFAVWCTYKYLNSGPGGIGGLYVHEKHSDRPRLSGWWGNNLSTRFAMAETFDPAPGAAGFQTSTPSILTLASLLGSLQTFLSLGKEEASQQETPASTVTAMKKLQRKSRLMTAYLLLLLRSSSFFVPMKDVAQFEAEQAKSGVHKPGFTVITPEHPDHRGAQLSILLLPRNKGMLPLVMEALMRVGVYGDEREPDVIRFAPVPLYNTFRDCWMAYRSLQWAVDYAGSIRRNTPAETSVHADGNEGESQLHMPRSS